MDRDEVCTRFLDSVEFELYPFQEEALLAWFEAEAGPHGGGGVLITVPTGMGKTLIAEAAIFEALHTGRRLYYTTPLIALTDQKFREFQQKAEDWGFPRDQIGLVTGNRRINPDACVRIVVAEILLNHLIAEDMPFDDVGGVVMDEFHYFNDFERGVVWELSLTLLPKHIRLMLLSATVGNPVEFVAWVKKEHDRTLRLVQSDQRRVPLEYVWVADKLLTEQLPAMVTKDDAENRSPALVFCFNRDECWDVAERLKGLKLIDQPTRQRIESQLDKDDFAVGAGIKLKQMLIRGVGVHHAGILPKYKEAVEALFLDKLIPLVVCTETLAAGINLPARSVVISTLMKGKRGEKKLIAPSAAHQMFGRAGRPQFDTHGYVYSLAHEDDVKIDKWRRKYDLIDPNSKDPSLMRARKDLERKKPSRRKTEQYWTEGQFRNLIEAGSAKLASRSMIPYQVLIYLLTSRGSLRAVREVLAKRFNTPERLAKFQDRLDHMISNLARFEYLTRAEDDDHVTLNERIHQLTVFRSVDPLYGAFLVEQLLRGSFDEKVQALESVLQIPTAIERKVRLDEREPGPAQEQVVQPQLIHRGLVIVDPEEGVKAVNDDRMVDYWDDDENWVPPLSFPEMLKMLFDARLETPEDIWVQPKWISGGIFDHEGDFYKYVRAKDLVKNEGLILRHLLRLIILAGECQTHADGDPDYERIGELATGVCRQIDPSYTDRFLESDQQARSLSPI